MTGDTGWASFAGRIATDAVECIDVLEEPERLATGTWFVVADFEAGTRPRPGGGEPRRGGRARAWRFARVHDAGAPPATPWTGPLPTAWTSSMDQAGYEAAVGRVREHVRDGDVYQANICRVLSAPLALPRATRRRTRPRSTSPPRRVLTRCGW